MDQGVIRNIKCFYRRHMIERKILCTGNQKTSTITLLTAMHMLVRAWEQVTPSTIANCFHHCGFAAGSMEESGDDGSPEPLPAAVRAVLQDVSFDDYVEVDSDAAVCGARSDEDIVAEIVGEQSVPEEAEDEDDDEEQEPVRPSAAEVMGALNVSRLFFSFEEGEEDSLRRIRALEDRVTTVALREKKQKMITDCFAK
ncbi:hypothetical protein V5799_009931 [Amblyomma americanum]|uniref:DDE-1 domain-containing protein n=1 Tax=Amblyomma americanum TaxID=6943 RepID=A0AAQ4F8Z0_AMBAM